MAIRICPECGGKVSTTREDCPHCGYQFLLTKRCPECSELVSADVTECPECGYYFKSESPQDVSKQIPQEGMSEPVASVSSLGTFEEESASLSDEKADVTIENSSETNDVQCPFCGSISNDHMEIGLSLYRCAVCKTQFVDPNNVDSAIAIAGAPPCTAVGEPLAVETELTEPSGRAEKCQQEKDTVLDFSVLPDESAEKSVCNDREEPINECDPCEEELVSVSNRRGKRRIFLGVILALALTAVLVILGKCSCYKENVDDWDFRVESNGTVKIDKYRGNDTIVKIPSKIQGSLVTSIGSYAFSNCTGLTGITIPNSVTSIGGNVFSGCTGLTSITIPNSVTSIGSYAFSNCTGLTNITIPDGVTSIGDSTFQGCTRLTSITIPNSVTSIGDGAFSGCTGLASIIIPDSVKSIGNGALGGCRGLTSIIIPDSVTSIGTYAFNGCTGLTSITIPNSVTSIGFSAFKGCTGLHCITIPNSMMSINSDMFYGCTGLASITIPNSVMSIGSFAIYGCTGLANITFNGTQAQWKAITKEMHWNDNTGNYVIYCTDGDLNK